MPSSLAIGGYVLAGGKSRRFGTDKALFNWQGKTLVEHALAALRSVSGESTWLVVDPVRAAQWRAREIASVLEDTPGQAGPLGGFMAAFDQAKADGLDGAIVVACDMPLLSCECLRELVECFSHEPTRPWVPKLNERWEPFHGIWPVDATCQALRDQRFARLQELCEHLRATNIVPVSQLPRASWTQSTSNVNQAKDLPSPG